MGQMRPANGRSDCWVMVLINFAQAIIKVYLILKFCSWLSSFAGEILHATDLFIYYTLTHNEFSPDLFRGRRVEKKRRATLPAKFKPKLNPHTTQSLHRFTTQ